LGGDRDGPERFGLLASALSGRTLRVARGEPGEKPWTDGNTIFVGADSSPRAQREALAVQASLLAAGSLERGVVRRLARRPALARRYLAVEGHRALAANEQLLPLPLRSLIDPGVASRSDSPATSLAAARSRRPIADPPDCFGVIRARALLASSERGAQVELDLAEEGEACDAADAFSSGRGGALGRLLQRMLTPIRQLGGGAPGAEAPTHRMRASPRRGSATLSAGSAGSLEDAAVASRGRKYPEWDVHQQRYRTDWCTVIEVEPRLAAAHAPFSLADRHGLRRALARLGTGLEACHRQVQGADIDLDAAIEARVDALAGSAPDDGIYVDSLRRRRDLAVLLLLDVSGSVAEPGASGARVHEHQRAAAGALALALGQLGDRVALYAFHSRGRSAVHVAPVKRFDDDLGPLVMQRLRGLVPAAYSRIGAAIRHGAGVLEGQGGTSRRLLVVLSDGLAYDHGYEREYGAADARRALAEARRRGTACLCLSVGATTDAEALRRVFGSAAHAAVQRPDELRRVIGPLFRSALRSAEVRRRGGDRWAH
jgi:hypothetical protein